MDEVEKRLRETSDHCFSCYEAWRKDQKNGDLREALQEAIHEIRKVASRLEIELAVKERDEVTQKPIPIPPHRDANRRAQGNDDRGNQAEGQPSQRPPSRRRPPNKKPSSGGGGKS